MAEDAYKVSDQGLKHYGHRLALEVSASHSSWRKWYQRELLTIDLPSNYDSKEMQERAKKLLLHYKPFAELSDQFCIDGRHNRTSFWEQEPIKKYFLPMLADPATPWDDLLLVYLCYLEGFQGSYKRALVLVEAWRGEWQGITPTTKEAAESYLALTVSCFGRKHYDILKSVPLPRRKRFSQPEVLSLLSILLAAANLIYQERAYGREKLTPLQQEMLTSSLPLREWGRRYGGSTEVLHYGAPAVFDFPLHHRKVREKFWTLTVAEVRKLLQKVSYSLAEEEAVALMNSVLSLTSLTTKDKKLLSSYQEAVAKAYPKTLTSYRKTVIAEKLTVVEKKPYILPFLAAYQQAKPTATYQQLLQAVMVLSGKKAWCSPKTSAPLILERLLAAGLGKGAVTALLVEVAESGRPLSLKTWNAFIEAGDLYLHQPLSWWLPLLKN